jgi:uncharacterized protein (DUF58 family)
VSFGVGWVLGWPELAVPGAAVITVFAIGTVSSLGNPKFEVELTAGHRRVPVGSDPEVKIRARNVGRRRSPAQRLTLPVAERQVPVRLPALAPGESVAADVSVPTGRRAMLPVGPTKAVRGDPFGMVGRTWSWGNTLEVVVYPPTVTVPVSWPGMAKDIEGKPTGQPSEADVSFHALREYVHGDDIRSIHWRSTARLGHLMVRQSEDTRRVQMVLLVSTAPEEYARRRDFELAVSVYASLGLAQAQASGDLAVLAGGSTLPIAKAGPGPVLDHAAASQLGPPGAANHSLASAAGRSRREAPRATLAILVTGTKLPVSAVRRAAWFLPREASALALRCEQGAELTVSKIGRLGLGTIGSLDELPRALRRLGLQ